MMRTGQSNNAAGALALLREAGDPEKTEAAIARIEEKESHARQAAKVAREEITLLEKTRKELDVHAKAMEAAQAKSEADLVSRQVVMTKLEESVKRRGKSLVDDRTILRGEQKTHKETSQVEMDRLKNLQISLSGKEKSLKKEQSKLHEQAIKLNGAMADANTVKAEFEYKIEKLTATLADI